MPLRMRWNPRRGFATYSPIPFETGGTGHRARRANHLRVFPLIPLPFAGASIPVRDWTCCAGLRVRP
jgi:hypothetical protein